MITPETIFQSTGIRLDCPDFDCIGLSDCTLGSSVLTFLDNGKYAAAVNRNPHLKGVFVKASDKDRLRPDIAALVVEDPKWCFFSMISFQGKNRRREATVIAPSARIHPSAVIAPEGVVIGEDTVVEPNVSIMPDVTVGSRCTIRAGAVIGVDGFEHKRTSKGLLSVVHDGQTVIGDDVEIGANNFIAKGFSYRPTVIGSETKLDALVHYAHGVQCGESCMIAAGAVIAGNVSIGNRVWIGPSATVSNRLSIGDKAYITIGSVVVRNVKAGEQVSGNFAIPHEKNMNVYKNNLKNA